MKRLFVLTLALIFLLSGLSLAAETNCHQDPTPPCVTCPPGPPGPPGRTVRGPRGPRGLRGPRGPRGPRGNDGRTEIIYVRPLGYTCDACLEDRINMGDAVIAALQSPYVSKGKRVAFDVGLGGMEDQKAIGIGAAVRLTKSIYLNGSVGTNLDEVCDPKKAHCLKHYDQFELVGWKVHLNIEF